MTDKRFFQLDDSGTYCLVAASSLEQAKQLMQGSGYLPFDCFTSTQNAKPQRLYAASTTPVREDVAAEFIECVMTFSTTGHGTIWDLLGLPKPRDPRNAYWPHSTTGRHVDALSGVPR